MSQDKSLIEIRTGSGSDIPKIKRAYECLDAMGISYSPRILSAHRTPEEVTEEAKKLTDNGFLVSIAAAGGAAHLPGKTAPYTLLPVVGLPVNTTSLDGQDSLYSIIQMPEGISVGTVGAGQAESAAILAAQIAYNNNPDVRNRIRKYRGLEGKLPDGLETNPLIGIVEPKGVEVDELGYGQMLFLLKEFGLQKREYDISVTEVDRAKPILREMENEGAMALITIGALADEDTTNYFPRFIAEHTDLPTIGLPIAREFAGTNPYSKGDIFHGMLCLSDPEEETRGYPVAGMGINRYVNAALFASQIAGLFVPEVQAKVKEYRANVASRVKETDARLKNKGIKVFLE